MAEALPKVMEELSGEHGIFLVHMKWVRQDSDGQVWVRTDAPLKLPVLLIRPDNWLSVELRREDDEVFRPHAWPGGSNGRVNWNESQKANFHGTAWIGVQFREEA